MRATDGHRLTNLEDEYIESEDAQPDKPQRRLSRVLRELALRTSEPISVAEIRDALADRSFAALLVVFSAINLLPWPPGTTLVLGLPIVIIAVQLMLGKGSAWLPRFVMRKTLQPQQMLSMTQKLWPILRRVEYYIKPRYWPMQHHLAERLIGVFVLVMGLAVTLPIPFGNWFPALSTTLAGLALSERDGLLLVVSVVVGIFALFVMALVIGAAGAAANFFFSIF